MALLVHLPLTGDLHNQGLAELTYTGTPVFKTTGKIGNSAFDLSHRVTFNCPSLDGIKTFSIAFWGKVNSDTNLSTNWVDVISFTDRKSDGSVTGVFCWETCYGGTNYTNWGISVHDNGYYNISDLAGIPQATGKNIWHHIVITVDLENNEVKEYLNGVLVGTATCNGGSLTGAFHLGENNLINGEIQDVRVYSHCLSQKKISELKKALVLHFCLDNNGVGNKNLLRYQIKDSQWTNWQSSSSWNDSNTREKVVIDGRTWGHVVQNSTDGYGGYAISPSNNEITLDPSKNYTWSCLAKAGTKANAEIVLWCYWRSTEGGANLSQNSKKFQLDTTPKRIYWNLPKYTDSTYTVNKINLMMGIIGTANNEVYFTDVKFEEGDKATPWCPNSSDALYTALGYDDGIEYDTSGYGNNGTYYIHDSTGDIIYSINSPRYLASTQLLSANSSSNSENGTVYLYGNCSIVNPNQLTIAFWCKAGIGYGNFTGQGQFCTTNGDYGNTSCGIDYLESAMNHRDAAIDVNNSAGDIHLRLPVDFTQNEWHHYAFTYDGQTAKAYKDGVQTSSVAFSSATPLGSFKAFVLGLSRAGGVWRRNTSTYSDARVYVTCLSDEEIQKLYTVSASIDSNGNAYSAAYVEG